MPNTDWTRRRAESEGAAGQSWALDGRAKEELLIILNEEPEHRAASGIGIICITSGSDSRDMAFSGGGALSGLPFRRRRQRAARAVGAAKSRCRALGLFHQVGVRLAHRGSLARRRVQRRASRRPGTVDVPGLCTACAIIRSSVSVTRVVGLVSNAVLRSPG